MRITVSLWRKNESWGERRRKVPRYDGDKEGDEDGDGNKHEISGSERTKKDMSELNCPSLEKVTNSRQGKSRECLIPVCPARGSASWHYLKTHG